MELTTKRETIYGGDVLTRGKYKRYFVYLKGERIAYGATKEEAQQKAKQALSDAYTYIGYACEARQANDGSFIVFRQLSADTCMYEFCRNGKRGTGACMGHMTDGNGDTFRTMAQYADYVVARYNEATA